MGWHEFDADHIQQLLKQAAFGLYNMHIKIQLQSLKVLQDLQAEATSWKVLILFRQFPFINAFKKL